MLNRSSQSPLLKFSGCNLFIILLSLYKTIVRSEMTENLSYLFPPYLTYSSHCNKYSLFKSLEPFFCNDCRLHVRLFLKYCFYFLIQMDVSTCIIFYWLVHTHLLNQHRTYLQNIFLHTFHSYECVHFQL